MIGVILVTLIYFVSLWVLSLVATLITLHFDWSEEVLMSAIITLTILALGVVISVWLLIIVLVIGLFI